MAHVDTRHRTQVEEWLWETRVADLNTHDVKSWESILHGLCHSSGCSQVLVSMLARLKMLNTAAAHVFSMSHSMPCHSHTTRLWHMLLKRVAENIVSIYFFQFILYQLAIIQPCSSHTMLSFVQVYKRADLHLNLIFYRKSWTVVMLSRFCDTVAPQRLPVDSPTPRCPAQQPSEVHLGQRPAASPKLGWCCLQAQHAIMTKGGGKVNQVAGKQQREAC